MSNAKALVDAGRLDEAAEQCRALLARDVGDLDALHLLGLILLQQGSAAEAVPLLSTVAAHNAEPAALNDLGKALHAAGLPGEAEARFRAAIAPDTDLADPCYNLGCLLLARGEHVEAAEVLRKAVTLQPDFAEAWLGLGNALLADNQPEEAENCYREAIALQPDYIEALNNLGNALLARHRPDAAAAAYRTALEHRPDSPELWLGLGNAMLETNDAAESERCFRTAIDLRPDHVAAINNLGNALVVWRRPEDAAEIYHSALARCPDSPDLLLGLGNALLETNAGESERCFRAALAARPIFANATSSLATSLLAQHRLDEAFEAYATALRLDPTNFGIHNDRALGLLLAGRFDDGWREHEARRNVDRMRPNYDRRPTLPQWHEGMSLEGRRVLLTMEQGFGDAIQFVRYVPMLAARPGVSLVTELPRELHKLFPALASITDIIAPDDPTPDCDISCPLMSLPLYFGTTLSNIPADVPYATVLPERRTTWRDWLGPRQGRRIGLACSGRRTHALDHRRSIPLARFTPLFDVPAHEFFLLQADLRDPDAATLETLPGLRWPGPELHDFGDTAALVAEMDLVVTVDTSLAHLAGALGKPVWVMLHFVPDYRWLLNRRDSPWYPTMTLYRQPRLGDWDAVIEAVRHDLHDA